MNAGVPTRLPACVCDPASGMGWNSVHARVSSAASASSVAGVFSPRSLASPQSITWTSPKAPTMTLAGLRSRWMTRWAWAAVGEGADLVDGRDAGVLQLAGDPRFAEEALGGRRVGRVAFGQQLDRD